MLGTPPPKGGGGVGEHTVSSESLRLTKAAVAVRSSTDCAWRLNVASVGAKVSLPRKPA